MCDKFHLRANLSRDSFVLLDNAPTQQAHSPIANEIVNESTLKVKIAVIIIVINWSICRTAMNETASSRLARIKHDRLDMRHRHNVHKRTRQIVLQVS